MKRILILSALMALAFGGPLTAQETSQEDAQEDVVRESGSESGSESGGVQVPEPPVFPEGAATDNEGTDIVEGTAPDPPPPDPVQPEVETPPTWAHWYFMTEPDPRSGGRQHLAFVTEPNDPFGRIYVQCNGEGRLYVFVTTPYLGLADKHPPIRYRINKEKPVALKGLLAQDGRAVFFSQKRGAFLRDLRRGTTVDFVTQRQDGYPIALSFTLTGSSHSIGRVLSACDYDAGRDRTAVERDAEEHAKEQSKLNAEINREFKRPKSGIQVETLY